MLSDILQCFIEARLDRNSGKSKPLYRQIYSLIRNYIHNNKLRPGQRLPSRAEMVRCFDVEYRTVNAALDLLAKEGIVHLEEKGGILVSKNSRPILKKSLVYIYWGRSLFHISISEGCRRFAEETKMEYVALDVSRSLTHFASIVNKQENGIAGFVIIPWDFPAFRNVIQQALDQEMRIVFVDHDLPGMEISTVSSDHYTGAYKAATHLLEHHDGPVYYVGSTAAPGSCKDRYDGWRQAMLDYGFVKPNEHVFETVWSDEELSWTIPESAERIQQHKETALKLFRSNQKPPYCIFTSADNVARGVYEAAEETNLIIGKDIFVASYGDKPFCVKLPVPLTSVFTDDEKVGYEAMRILYNQLMGVACSPIHRVLPVRLNVRESSIGRPAARQETIVEYPSSRVRSRTIGANTMGK